MQDNDKENISVRDALKLIPPRRRRGAAWMVAGSLLLALLDFAGIAALVSALLVVLDPQAMVEYPVIAHIYSALGFGSVNGLVITVAVAALAVIALKSLFTLTVSNAMNKYLLSLYRHYSTRMFDIYLSKGLLFIRRNHTSQLVNNVNGVCLRFTEGVLGQLLGILSTALLLVLIFTVLLIYDPMIVLLAVVVFLPLALVYSRFFRRRMVENGKMENKLFVGLNKTMYETLRGYSDVEINNAEAFVSEKFTGGLKNLADYRRRAALVRGASGSVVEFSLVLGVVIMIVGGLSMGSDMASLRVSLGVFAIAAYKIVPAVNRIVNNWVEYKRNSFAGGILRDSFADAPEVDFSAQSKEKMPFEKELVLRDVSFTYDGAGPETESQTEPRSKVEYNGKKVLDRFSLTVKKGEKIGIRGYSGAGKSTLFNIVCGFFEPASGAITIDGVPLTADNRRRWQNNLAYVSQDVFIPDMTIAENIAFGVDRSEIDMQRLDKVIRAASLDGLIASLPDGADTVTGESGCRLSGGQRQRIGIARALYKNASVLLFDEATSSLDSKTEDEIVTAIEKLSVEDSRLTMLIISHRDRTLNFCDRIIELD